MAGVLMSAAMRIKRLLRPMIPDVVMARYRLAQHSRQIRTNVDIVPTDPSTRKRWLATTPDTYRVVEPGASPDTPTPAEGVVAFGSDIGRAITLLAVPGAEVGVVARVEPPALIGRRRTEPAMEPVAIAAHRDVVEEVDGLPGGERPLPGLLARLRDAGRRITVQPVGAGTVDATRRDPIPSTPVVVLAAVPLHDIGGGSRAAQLTFALLRRGYHVTYVAMHGTQESIDLGLRYIHPHLEQYRADQFDPSNVTLRSEHPGLALVEVPAGTYREPLDVLASAGWTVGYDIIDDWSDPALGGDWYNASTERWIVERSDFVVVSAPDLGGVARRSGVEPALIPNAVNREIFEPEAGERPPDMPRVDGPLIGYHGSLYGDWFDWDAVQAIADAHPGGVVVVIGDDRAGTPAMPDNVVFTGLKAQQDLPAYVQRFDVGILPFHVTDTTHAVSPLKVYEYLASGVPVAAPPLRSLDDLDGVYRDADPVAAVRAALDAPRPDRREALDRHSWEARISDLLRIADLREPDGPGGTVVTVRRPVTHYRKQERHVRFSPGTAG